MIPYRRLPFLYPNATQTVINPTPLPNGTSTVVSRSSNYFNGLTDYYTYPDSPNFDYPDSDWTVCALIKFTKLAGTQYIWNHGATGGTQNVQLYINTGVVTGQISTSGASSTVVTGATLAINDVNGWFIIGIRRTGTNYQVFSCPVSGTVTNGATQAITVPGAITPSGSAFVASRQDALVARLFNGFISYIFKLDGALTDSDVNNLAAGQDIQTDLGKTPSLYSKFHSIGVPISDSGTGGNTATPTGNPRLRGCHRWTGIPVAINTSTNEVDTVYAKVYQREAGKTTKTVSFTGTYTGAPAGIEARVVGPTGTQLVGWVRATTPSVGVWAATLPNIPQGGELVLEVRHVNNTANIQRTQLPWGVGIIFISAGESLEDQRSVGAGGFATTDFTPNGEVISAYQQSTGLYRDVRGIVAPSNQIIHSLTRLSIALGIPVAHYNGATSGTTLLPNSGNTWSVSGSAVQTAFATALTNAGGDAEIISIRLGTNDGNNATKRTEAEWAAQFPTMVSLLRANFSRTAAQLPVFASETCTNTSQGSPNDNNYRAVRNAQQNNIPLIANCRTQGASHSLTHDDDLHPSVTVSGYWRFEKMFAQAVLNYLDNVTYTTGLKGAVPTGAVINGSTIDISYTLNNGTTLQGLTGATGLTGFIVYGASQSITSATLTNTTITSINRSGTTATVTTPVAHGLSAGQTVFINGAGTYHVGPKLIVATPTATTFTYTVSASSTASQSGGSLRFSYATVSSTAHGLTTGDRIGVFGATTNIYNMADAAVTVIDANTFFYPINNLAEATATGTVTFRKQITITTTAIPSSTMVRLTPASTPVTGWQVDYVPGQNPNFTNMLYTNGSIIGDTAGVPARAWQAPITL